MIPYVYKLTNRETGQFYIGYREANVLPACEDLPKYKTSSKYVKEIGFENFDWEILLETPDGEAAFDLEQRLISESFDDPLCLNRQHRHGGVARFKPDVDKLRESKRGVKLSEEAKEKIRRSKLGKKSGPISEATKEKQRKAMTGRVSPRKGQTHSDDAKDKLRQANLGKSASDDTKSKMSASQKGAKWMHHPDTLINTKVKADEVERYLSDGWLLGRKK